MSHSTFHPNCYANDIICNGIEFETCTVLHPKHNSRLISLITVIFLYLVWTLLAAPAVSLTPECNSMGCYLVLAVGWRKSLPFQGSCLKISLEWVALLPYAPEETASHSTNSIQKLQEEKLERYEQRFRTSYEKWKSLIKEGKRLLAEFSSNDLLQDVMTRVSCCWFCL